MSRGSRAARRQLSVAQNKRGEITIRNAAVVERELRALELLVEGLSAKDIAEAMGVSRSGADLMIKRALTMRFNASRDMAERARQLHIERLERLLQAWMPTALAKGADPRDADVVLKILDQLAKITGSYAPQQAGDDGTPDARQASERAALTAAVVNQLAEMAARARVIDGELADARAEAAAVAGETVP